MPARRQGAARRSLALIPGPGQETISRGDASTLSGQINLNEVHLKTYQFTVAICSALLAFATTFAQAPPSDAGLTASSVYQKDCAKCHGRTAEGRHFGGPSLISEKTAATSTDDMRKMITNGKGHMPKFGGKLTAEEIDALVRQIQALNKK
jgi:mono/diheme cytochrome c family protein